MAVQTVLPETAVQTEVVHTIKIVHSLNFGDDCKIVISSRQLLYVTFDHVIYRPFRTLIHENLQRNFQKNCYMKIYRENDTLKIVKFKRL